MESNRQSVFYTILDWAVLLAAIAVWGVVLGVLIYTAQDYRPDSGMITAFVILSLLVVLKILSMIFFTSKIIAEMKGSDGLEFELTKDGKGYCVCGEGGLRSINVVIPAYFKRRPVVAIGDYVFKYDRRIASVVISENVKSIGREAFSDCGKLMKIYLPQTLESIDDGAFNGCHRLYEVYNRSNIELIQGGISYGGVARYAKVVHTKVDAENVTGYKDDVVYESVKEKIYLATTSLWNKVVIGEDLKDKSNFTLAPYCMEYEEFSEVVLPENLEKIPEGAFSNCMRLEKIYLPDGVLEISENAFENCINLREIRFPESLGHIGENAFSGCYGISSIKYSGSRRQYGKIFADEGNELLHEAKDVTYGE